MSLDPLIVDAYAGDLNGNPNWSQLAAAGLPWAGAIIKCTEGTSYAPGWFLDNWRELGPLGGDRRGISWFRGCYHYWRASSSATAQAELYLSMVDAAGGWRAGDLWPIVDVENAGNQGTTKAQVEDGISAWSSWITARTGRPPMLYGGSFIRDLGITSHMGCGLLWTARYAATLPPSTYESMGWSRDRLWGWQYRGTSGETPVPTGYPTTTPIGRLDTTAMVIDDVNGSEAPLAFTRERTGGLT